MAIYMWREWPTPITTAWIYWDEADGLISLSNDGSNWLTIADKNLGATSTDVTSSDSYGYFYQRGNCYGFPTTWSVTTSSSYVNISSYWPSNYYRNSTWRTMSQSYSSYTNLNLWGWTTWTNEAMKWPCDTWFHIPKDSELQNLLTTWMNITWHTTSDIAYFSSELLIPRAWERRYSDASRINAWSYMWLWASTAQNSNYWKVLVKDSASIRVTYMDYTYWCNIRPFKNEAVQPDETRTVLYQ